MISSEKLPEEQIEELIRQKLEGTSYSEIRVKLAEQGLSLEEIRSVIRRMDEKVLQAEVEGGSRLRARSWYRIGLGIAVIGLLLTVGNNSGVLLEDLPRWLVYAPFFIGILMMFYGRMLQRRQSDPLNQKFSKIRSKRPYK
jgi:hypothetical protein